VQLYPADLHIHTALSPCAADEMTPPAIVQTARKRGLAMIAVCDHNSADNTAAAQAAARAADRAVAVLAGVEITTAEEVHVVGLFPAPQAAEAAAAELTATLPPADEAYYARFGPQRWLDAEGRERGAEPHMLALATGFDLAGAVALVHRHGGLAIAAHVNRPSFSVLSQLGFFPADAGFDALEVFTPAGVAVDEAAAVAAAAHGLPVLASSDSHTLGDIGRARSVFTLAAPTFEEVALALRGAAGRGVRCA